MKLCVTNQSDIHQSETTTDPYLNKRNNDDEVADQYTLFSLILSSLYLLMVPQIKQSNQTQLL